MKITNISASAINLGERALLPNETCTVSRAIGECNPVKMLAAMGMITIIDDEPKEEPKKAEPKKEAPKKTAPKKTETKTEPKKTAAKGKKATK